MEKRNILSLFLLVVVTSSIVVSGLLTIRNYEEIVEDLQNTNIFPTEPIDNGDDDIKTGILELFYLGSVSENQVLKSMTNYGPPNATETLQNVWINVTKIELVGNDSSLVKLFEDHVQLDIKKAEEETIFLFSFNITEGTYPAIKIFYENTLIVKTTEGTVKTYTIQGSNFLVVPFLQNKYSTNQSNLEISKNVKKSTYIDFNVNLISFTQSAVINIQAFLSL
ncbi:MAG: hypothetical protein ACTSSL_09675 [Candidatus Heimdallarchaeaceae archaeon]